MSLTQDVMRLGPSNHINAQAYSSFMAGYTHL
jgi:hypothetical protein